MNSLQQKQLSLLSELDELCRENGLNYFLANEAALCAYRSNAFEGERSSANIYMPYSDMLKLRKIILSKNNPHRLLDSLIDNPYYPDTTFRYSDEDTLFYFIMDNIGDVYQSHGIYIKICPLFRIRGEKATNHVYSMEKIWRENHIDINTKKRWNSIIYKLFRVIMVWLLNYVNKDYKLSNKLMFIGLKGKKTIFPSGLFSEKMEVELEGKKFFIPKKAEKYFERLYSFNWSNKAFPSKSIPESFVIDDCIPYKVYFEHINKQNISCNTVKLNKRLKELENYTNPLTTPIDNAWTYVKLSVAKYVMMDKYLAQKEHIVALCDAQNWEELDKLLEEYQDLALTFAADGFLLNFDDEIFDVLKKLQIQKGNNAFVEKLKTIEAKQ